MYMKSFQLCQFNGNVLWHICKVLLNISIQRKSEYSQKKKTKSKFLNENYRLVRSKLFVFTFWTRKKFLFSFLVAFATMTQIFPMRNVIISTDYKSSVLQGILSNLFFPVVVSQLARLVWFHCTNDAHRIAFMFMVDAFGSFLKRNLNNHTSLARILCKECERLIFSKHTNRGREL